MRRNLDRQLAKYLRRKRGGLSYAQFSRRVGLSHTTLHRLERGEHHLTLSKLGVLLDKLKVQMRDIFPGEF
ncbi:MAG: hypothetical protein C5B50_21870 [Verrucomicrobia bacterium]|nr:MAG: hypothetical protein C5B50_21870 [Verrucomicrobiota bacterium]